MTAIVALPAGMLLPPTALQSEAFAVLATFVALNTLMYATLALLKLLPKGYSFFRTSGRNRRRQNRSIYPDTPEAAEAAPPTTTTSGT